jgi:hypothetical protein
MKVGFDEFEDIFDEVVWDFCRNSGVRMCQDILDEKCPATRLREEIFVCLTQRVIASKGIDKVLEFLARPESYEAVQNLCQSGTAVVWRHYRRIKRRGAQNEDKM